jgi:hypothetical protein
MRTARARPWWRPCRSISTLCPQGRAIW